MVLQSVSKLEKLLYHKMVFIPITNQCERLSLCISQGLRSELRLPSFVGLRCCILHCMIVLPKAIGERKFQGCTNLQFGRQQKELRLL